MDGIVGIILLVLFILGLPVILSIITLVRVGGLRRRLDDLEERVERQATARVRLRRDIQEQPFAAPSAPSC